MRPSFPAYRILTRLSGMIVIAAVLAGCAGGPETKSPDNEVKQTPQDVVEASAPLPRSRFSAQFSRAEQYLLAFDWMAAGNTLADIPPEQTNATDGQYLGYLQARILYLKGEQTEARELLEALSRSSLDPAIQSKINNFQRYMLSMSGKPIESARYSDLQLKNVPAGQPGADALIESIWYDLQRAPAAELRAAMTGTTDRQWQGWITLSLLTAESKSDAALRQGLTRWRAENPVHPAAGKLPGGLEYILQQNTSLEKVAIMLPLSGRLAPAGKAVRDGYLANYYTSQRAGDAPLELQIVDLDRYDSVVTAYEEATSAGAQLVIGPLSKQAVATLGKHPNRQTPILTLNQIGGLLPTSTTALIQLALAPEDEAGQIARLAFGEGARRAVIIRPGGSWGSKMEQALTEQWTALGGQVSGVASYSSQEDYSSSMATALNLPESEQRARDVRSMLATNIEFTARRRQDLDAIFLLCRNGSEARSLKPLLAYHYAGELPVYATSAIYRGTPDKRDKDLNGVKLLETPWLLNENPALRTTLNREIKGNNNYARLNALGADAYLLQSRLSQLQAGPNVHIRGNTGLLSLDPQLRIVRELQPATFDGSALKAH
ncbi:MAG: penicillin-binding protein activator [Halioglobus sp.]